MVHRPGTQAINFEQIERSPPQSGENNPKAFCAAHNIDGETWSRGAAKEGRSKSAGMCVAVASNSCFKS